MMSLLKKDLDQRIVCNKGHIMNQDFLFLKSMFLPVD